jgi:hypothetical protein
MSNWLANATGVHISPHRSYINRDQMGNALKNIAPAAFLIPGIGTAAAMGLGGLGSAFGRGIQHGANIGNILGQGLSGAAIAGGGAQGMNALRGAFAPSSVTAAPSGFASAPGGGWQAIGAQAGDSGPGLASSFGQGLGHAASGVAHFAKEYPMAVSGGLQGIGAIANSGSENRLRNAQADAMQRQADESDYEFQQRKARDLALEPLRRALAAQIGQSIGTGY